MKQISLLCFAIMVLFTACNDGKPKLETVKVAQFGDVFIYTPLYLADSKGFFEEEGLKIDLINTGGDDKTYAAVISGSAQFGVADPTFAAIAKEKGIDGRVIGGIVNGVPFWALAKNTSIPSITEASMLKPYSVATFSAPSTAYTIQLEMFKLASIEPNIKQGAFGTLIPMLDAGRADIALELEPNVSIALNKGAKIVYSFIQKYPEFAFTGITASKKTIDENPHLVQRFMNAITKAEKYAHEYPDSAAFYMSKYYPDVNVVVVKEAVKRMVDSNTLPQNAVISKKAWEQACALRNRIGDLKSMNDIENILDMSFATKASTKINLK